MTDFDDPSDAFWRKPQLSRREQVQSHIDRAKVFQPSEGLTPEEIERKRQAAVRYLRRHDSAFGLDPSPEATARRLGFSVGDDPEANPE